MVSISSQRFLFSLCLVALEIQFGFGDRALKMNRKKDDTCPCIPQRGSSECKPYDPHYQALTLEEAVLHFVDPTNPEGDHSLLDTQQNGDKPSCDTPACFCCTMAVLDKIKQSLGAGLGPKDVSTAQFLNATEQNLKKRHGRLVNCQKYADQCHLNTSPPPSTPQPNSEKRPSKLRYIRQNGLGTSTQLSCNYRRGNALNDGSNYVGLCNLCWSIRTLPTNYFPRFINELTCDTDTRCVSGWGTCRERTRSVDVMINAGTEARPRWNPVSMNSPVACECQILSGSALHNLVMS